MLHLLAEPSFFSHLVFMNRTSTDKICCRPVDTYFPKYSWSSIYLHRYTCELYVTMRSLWVYSASMPLSSLFLLSRQTQNFNSQGKKKTEKNRNVSPSLVGWLQLFCAFRYKDAQLINQLLSPIYCCVRYWSDVETLECSHQFWGSYLWIYVHKYFFSSCKSSKVIYCNGNDMCTKWLLQLQVISDLSHLFPCVVCCAHKATLY